jgi:hypothetical protein
MDSQNQRYSLYLRPIERQRLVPSARLRSIVQCNIADVRQQVDDDSEARG